jgi:1-acyl-sn-glycerol-3-phosphate acyltransferase
MGLESLKDRLPRLVRVPEIERAIDAVGIETNDLGYDPWGFSPEESKLYYSLAYYIYRYFRPVVHGIDRLPAGPVLVVGNHSGQLPFDALVVTVATLLHARPPRLLRAMAERWFLTLPFVGEAFNSSGVVLGDPINARNLLRAGNGILVFPEGARGSGKTWDHRYRLVPFGRGFMRLALQTDTPVVPVAIIGAEESIVSVYNVESLARLLKTPYFPIPPTLPLLGLAAYLPLPTRFHLHFGEPMHFSGRFDEEDEVVDEKVLLVMNRLQAMIDDGLAERKSVFA